MQESLPLILDSGGGGGAKIARASVIDMPTALGNINDLSQSLTIGGTAFAPCAYLVADDINPTTGAWASRHDTSKVLSVAGAGAAPTYAQPSAITNNSVKYNAAKYHQAADTTWGQFSSGDLGLELVVRMSGTTGVLLATKSEGTSASKGVFVYESAQLYCAISDGTSQILIGTGSGITGVVHLFVGIDRSDKIYLYTNGVYVAASASTSGISGDLTQTALTVGAYPTGLTPLNTGVICANMWNLASSPWPGAATNQAVMGAIAAERFAKVAGIYDRKSTVYSFARTTSAYLDRYVSAGVRQLFPVSVNWPRVCERVDNASVTDTGYLGELQATNLIVQSADITTTWAKLDVGDTVAANALLCPDGTVKAGSLIADSTDGVHGIYIGPTLTAATYTFSTYAKPGNQNWLLLMDATLANGYCYFNLATGAVGTKGADAVGYIEGPFLNGFYRVCIVFTGTVAAHSLRIYSCPSDTDNTFAGDGATVNTYVWGVQCELGERATAPIATAGAAVTRTKDSLVRTVAVTTGKLSTSCNVFLGTTHDNAAAKTLIAIDDATVNNFVAQTVTADDVSVLSVITGGAAAADVTGTQDITNGKWRNMAAKVRAKYAGQTVDGTLDGTPDTALATAANYTAVRIGCSGTSLTQQPNGLISKIKVYKDVL